VILLFWPIRASSENQISILSLPIAFSRAIVSRHAGKLKILDHTLDLRMMARTGRELAIAHGTQLPAERLLGDGDAKLFKYPLRQIDQPPAHHAGDCRNPATLDHPGERLALAIIELRRMARRLAVQESVRVPLVEVQHPVPDDLKLDAVDFRRLGARHVVINRRKSQKPTGLAP